MKNGEKRINKHSDRPVYLSEQVFTFMQMLTVALTVWLVSNMLMPYDWIHQLMTIPVTAIGFYAQLGVNKLIKNRDPDKIQFSHALITIALWGILIVVLYSPTYAAHENGLLPGLGYDSDYFTWTVFSLGFVFLTLMTGSLIAMIPKRTFFSYGTAYVFTVLYMIIWVLSLFGGGVDFYLMTAGSIITVIYFVALNQGSIDELNRTTKVMGVTGELRNKNLKLTALMLLALVGLLFAFATIITGVFFTIKSLLILFLRAALGSSEGTSGEVVGGVSEIFNGGLFGSPTVNKILYAIFAVTMVFLFVFACVKMITHSKLRLRDLPALLTRFFKTLWEKLRELFEWRKPMNYRPDRQKRQPYMDTVTQYTPSRYRFNVDSFDSFNRRIGELDKPIERFCYAYGVLISQWRRLDPKQPTGLLSGYTPREISDKLARYGQSGFDEITEMYETIRHAHGSVDNSDAERLTRRLCGYIENNFRINANK